MTYGNRRFNAIFTKALQQMCDFSEQRWFLQCEVFNPTPNPQAGGQLLVGCPRLIIQYNRS